MRQCLDSFNLTAFVEKEAKRALESDLRRGIESAISQALYDPSVRSKIEAAVLDAVRGYFADLKGGQMTERTSEHGWLRFCLDRRRAKGLMWSVWVNHPEWKKMKIGWVEWWDGPFKLFAFQPEAGVLLGAPLLRDLAAFCETLTKEHKARP